MMAVSVTKDYTVVTFPLARLNGRIVSQNVPQNVTQNDSQSDSQKTNLGIARLVGENNSISVKKMAESLNLSEITVRRRLKKLGYIWKGSSKNGCWVAPLNVTQNVTQNDSQDVTQNVLQNTEENPRVQKVEQIVLVDSMKTKEFLAKMFGVTTRTILRDLKKLGYAWEGASKNGHWVKKCGAKKD